MDRYRKLAELMGMCGWYCTKCDKPLRPAEVTYEENCLYCGLHLSDPDFSTPEWRARLMDWAVEQEWFTKFWHLCYLKLCKEQVIDVFPAWVWRNLPELVYQYDKERKGEGDE